VLALILYFLTKALILYEKTIWMYLAMHVTGYKGCSIEEEKYENENLMIFSIIQ